LYREYGRHLPLIPVRRLRNLFIAFHLVAVTAMAFPGPRAYPRSFLDSRASRAEMDQWVDMLDGIGVRVTLTEFADLVYTVGNVYASMRNGLAAPFDPYAEWCGTRQGWRMFSFIDRSPSRLEVDVEEGGVWRTVYRPYSSSERWKADLIEQEKIRGLFSAYSWRSKGTTYAKFAAWVAREAQRDFPAATRVRVQMRRITTPSAAEARASAWPEGTFEQILVFPP